VMRTQFWDGEEVPHGRISATLLRRKKRGKSGREDTEGKNRRYLVAGKKGQEIFFQTGESTCTLGGIMFECKNPAEGDTAFQKLVPFSEEIGKLRKRSIVEKKRTSLLR